MALVLNAFEESLEVLKVLVKHPAGLSPRVQKDGQKTPLALACGHSAIEQVRLMLTHPDIDVGKVTNCTPILPTSHRDLTPLSTARCI